MFSKKMFGDMKRAGMTVGLDGRKVLHWNDGSVKILDKKISSVNFKKLNDLTEIENCSVNQLISKLLKSYQKGKA